MPDPCPFTGNADLYGAGIRYGIYMQWVSAQLAVWLALKDAKELIDAYLILSAAIMAALVALSASTGLRVTEAVIMLHLFFGGLVCVPDHLFPRPVHRGGNPTRPRTWRTILSLSVWTLFLGYSAWFWILGRSTYVFTNRDCGTVIFLFAPISPSKFGSLSYLFAVISMILLLIYALIFSTVICMILLAWHESGNITVNVFFDWLKAKAAWLSPGHPTNTIYLYFFLPAALAYSVVAVELMLRWNKVSGIYQFKSTGQFIPFAIGVAGLVKVLLDIWHERKALLEGFVPLRDRCQACGLEIKCTSCDDPVAVHCGGCGQHVPSNCQQCRRPI